MTKNENVAVLDSCWNKAKPGEQVFILLERDPEFAATVQFWASRRVEHGHDTPDSPKIVSALTIAQIAENNSAERYTSSLEGGG